jgi:hypothetical protein
MQMKFTIALAALIVPLAVGSVALPVQAAGCLKGAAVGGVAGHVAGHHGVLGAGAGCVVGHHEAKKHAPQNTQQQEQQQGSAGNSQAIPDTAR